MPIDTSITWLPTHKKKRKNTSTRGNNITLNESYPSNISNYFAESQNKTISWYPLCNGFHAIFGACNES